jgi:Flp pilus assembly protein TadG
MVELALVLILFVTILLGIMGFGHLLYAYHFVNNAAKEATRWASVNGATCNTDSTCSAPASASDVNSFVQNHVPAGIVAANVVTSACGVSGGSACAASTPQVCTAAVGSQPATPDYPGCTVQVTVSYSFEFIFPLLPSSATIHAPCTKPGICLSSRSDMVIVH